MTATFFSGVVLVLFALSFSTLSESTHGKVVPGALWIGVAFAGALTLSRIFERERESDTLTALLAAPVERFAVYLSKVVLCTGILMISSAVFLPGLAFLFPGASGLMRAPLAALCLLALGCLGYGCIGTLFAAGLARAGGKNLLFTIILYPLTTPVLLLAIVATQRVMTAHPAMWSTLGQLAAIDLVLFVVSAFLFEPMLVGVRRQVPMTNRGRR